VLSIGKLTAAQTSYYERQVARGLDDYYSGRDEATGEWMGATAAALGLAGDVDEEGFAALMAGLDPASGEWLVRRSARSTVAAYDLTFSAPKSVGVLFAIADPETARAMVEAHQEAVTAALGYLESEACRVRRGHGGLVRQPAAGFVAAAYLHRMSRAEDPQLHTHVVAANLTRGDDGRWSALDGRALYVHAKAAGFLYQAHLRAAVRERLGWVEWGPSRNGMADIVGVPEGVLREFSTRRLQILERERELVAAGVSLGHAGRERVAHDTRRRKRYGIDTAPWRELVRARAAEHGLGAAELELLRAPRVASPPERHVLARAEASRLAGPSGLTEKRNTFATRDVVLGLAGAQAQGAPVEEIVAAAARFCARGDVLAVGKSRGDAIFTTVELLACEAAIVYATARRAHDGSGLLSAAVVDRALLGHGRPLNDDQAAAVRGIAQSGRGVDTIEALAGTGKTTTADALAAAYRQARYNVLGTAPTGRAVRELKEQARIDDSWTLAGLLRRLDRYEGRFPTGRSVLILDEAGMASTREVARLLAVAERSQVKVVAIGDPGQLPSVQAGGWLGSLGRRFGTHRLREVMRQRDPHERQLLELVHTGDPDLYVREKQAAGLLQLFDGDDPGGAAEQSAVTAWHAQQIRLPEGQAIMICRDNDRRHRLNQAARALLVT
jgi:conjugative relaxase-like TrwC/TraI family protein